MFRDDPGPLYVIVSELLRSAGAAASLTVEEVAARTGISAGQVSATVAPLVRLGSLVVESDHLDPARVKYRVIPDELPTILEMYADTRAILNQLDEGDHVVELLAQVPRELANQSREYVFRPVLPALTALFDEAKSSIRILNPFFDTFGATHIADPLVRAGTRGVMVQIITRYLTNGGRNWQVLQPLVAAFEERGCRSKLELYEYAGHLAGSSFHAKLAIIDAGVKAYLGSANLTQGGLSTQLELGVILAGVHAKTLHEITQILLNGYVSPNVLHCW